MKHNLAIAIRRFGHPAISRTGLSLLLMVMLCGGHVGLLQCVAWAGMLIDRLPQRGWNDALKSTFSGAEPCSLCNAINDALDHNISQQQNKADNAATTFKQVWRIEVPLHQRKIHFAVLQPEPWWLQLFYAPQQQALAWIHALEPPPPRMS